MHPNAELLERFYSAFVRRDGKAMAECYSLDATFTDPVFQDLRSARVGHMWQMLCERGKDLEVTYTVDHADDVKGRAKWEARYTFSATGKKVHNVIESSFSFRNGLIVNHVDRFDLRRWLSMALGLVGKLFGWTEWLQASIRKKAEEGLVAWERKNP